MPSKVTDFNGGVALTEIQDGDYIYVIRGGTDQFADVQKIKDYSGLEFVEVTMTAAQVAAAVNGSPFALTSTPAAGEIYIPVFIAWQVDGVYDSGSVLEFVYGNVLGEVGDSGLGQVMLLDVTSIISMCPAISSPVLAEPIGIHQQLMSTPPDLISGSGDVRIKIYYKIMNW
jgi:hypothetical protein